MNTIWPSGPFRTPTIRWRVVCGLSETIATFWPTNRLSSVDLPAFGRPTSETNPAFTRRLLGRRRQPPDADLVDAAALGLEDLDVEAVDREPLADRRHAADARQHVAADRLEPAVLDLDARAARPSRRSRPCALNTNVSSASRTIGSASHVVLVANLADQLLDDVLDGDEARRAAVLVDDDRQLEAASAGTRAAGRPRAWSRARTPPAA